MSVQSVDLIRKGNQAPTSTKDAPRCPGCHASLDFIPYIERGQKVWDGKGWQEDEAYGDIEFYCPDCDGELDYEFLEEIGLV